MVDRVALPSLTEVRAALSRVIDSHGFRAAPQLAAFLRFIVERTIAGEADDIRAATIAVAALHRPADFDAQSNSIVRVEAGRLRRALGGYYAGAGVNDPVVIEVPRGRYVPTFRYRDDGSAQTKPRRTLTSWLLLAATGMAIAFFAALAWRVVAPSRELSAASIDEVVAPVLTVEAIHSNAAPALADAIDRELVTTLRRVKSMIVVFAAAETRTDLIAAGKWPAFRLSGQVEPSADGSAQLSLRLTSEGVITWTRGWRIVPDEPEALADMARETTRDVGRMFGVMHARLRSRAERLTPGLRCLLAAADYVRGFDVSQHAQVRDCLERTTATNPRFAITYALLAFVYEREYFHDLPSLPGDEPPLERSLKAAQRIVELWPDSAIGQLALMENRYLRGDLAGAYAAGEAAIRLNPIEPMVSGLVGLRMVLGGDAARGAALLDTAAAEFGINPSWVDFGLFYLAYRRGDMSAAARYAGRETSKTYPYGLMARALVARATGQRDQARKLMDQLVLLHPAWANPRDMLSRFIVAPDIVDRLAGDLAAIGEP